MGRQRYHEPLCDIITQNNLVLITLDTIQFTTEIFQAYAKRIYNYQAKLAIIAKYSKPCVHSIPFIQLPLSDNKLLYILEKGCQSTKDQIRKKWNNESLTTPEAQLLLDHLYTIYHLVVNLQWHSPPPFITITEYDSKYPYRTKTLQGNGFAVLHHGDTITTENDPIITKQTFGHDSLLCNE
jgi:hypothetical protein